MPQQRKHKDELNEKEKIFLENYVVHFNATKAYSAAFPNASSVSARTKGSKWLTKDYIKAALGKMMKAEYKKRQITREKVLNRLDSIAFADDSATKAEVVSALKLMSKIEQYIDKESKKNDEPLPVPEQGLEIVIKREIIEK